MLSRKIYVYNVEKSTSEDGWRHRGFGCPIGIALERPPQLTAESIGRTPSEAAGDGALGEAAPKPLYFENAQWPSGLVFQGFQSNPFRDCFVLQMLAYLTRAVHLELAALHRDAENPIMAGVSMASLLILKEWAAAEKLAKRRNS